MTYLNRHHRTYPTQENEDGVHKSVRLRACRAAHAALISNIRGENGAVPGTRWCRRVGYSLGRNLAQNLSPQRPPCGGCRSRSLSRISGVFALALIFIATCVPLDHAKAQSLDISLDAAAGTGLLIGSAGNETYTGRTPLHLNLDSALIFDNDRTFEWIIGTIVQLETQPALALNPKLRLVKRTETVDIYAAVGLPWYVVPFRRLGVELGGGVVAPLNELLSIVAGLSIQTFFAGADVHDGTAVLELNGRFGVSVAF